MGELEEHGMKNIGLGRNERASSMPSCCRVVYTFTCNRNQASSA